MSRQHKKVSAIKVTAVATAVAAAMAAGAALADYRVTIHAIDTKGPGQPLGDVVISEAKTGGVVFTPALKGLSPGEHGFHVHENPSCEAKEKDGKLEPGEAAGPHYDPHKTGLHAGPSGGGHVGDLPALKVDGTGAATEAVTAPRLKLKELKGRSLVVHIGGDNNADQPAPNGGGGTRIACGVIDSKK